MATKLLLVLVLTLVTVRAAKLSFDDQEKQANQPNKDEIRDILINFFNKLKPALNYQAGGLKTSSDNSTSRVRRSTNLIDSILEPIVEFVSSEVNASTRQARSTSLQARDSLLSFTTYLNDLTKSIILYFLEDWEASVGQFILYPLRWVLDYLLDLLLPCGITCTLLS